MKKIKTGDLLIAEPFLGDPNFERAIILICEHNEKGSFGLVLNKSTEIMLSDVLVENIYPEVKIDIGGPVQQNTLHFLHTCPEHIENGVEIFKGLYWGGNFNGMIQKLNLGVINKNQIRFFIGYTGWAPEQLNGEIKKDSWIIAKTDLESVMKEASGSSWRETLKNLGGDYKVLSNYPTDPRMN